MLVCGVTSWESGTRLLDLVLGTLLLRDPAGAGLGAGDLQSSLLTSATLWFCDIFSAGIFFPSQQSKSQILAIALTQKNLPWTYLCLGQN